MDDAITAGAVLWDVGAYRAARAAWRPGDDADGGAGTSADGDARASAAAGSDAEARRGLAALAAAAALLDDGETAAACSRAERAAARLDGAEAPTARVDLGAARSFAAALAGEGGRDADDRGGDARPDPPALVGGADAGPRALGFEPIARAAAALAAADPAYDGRTVERAVSYARAEVDGGERTRFTALLFDFVGEGERRGLIYRRLAEHVDRRWRRERDVSGLFDPE